MKTAVQELERRLVDSGLTIEEADNLLYRLMLEEAFDFVKFTNKKNSFALFVFFIRGK